MAGCLIWVQKMEDLTCIAQRGIFIQGYQRRIQENFVVIFRYDTMIRGLNPWLVLIYCWGEKKQEKIVYYLLIKTKPRQQPII